MGRWGDAIFESDSAQDFFWGEFMLPMQRELTYLVSPEVIASNGRWLAKVFTILELMIMFEGRYHGGTVSVFLDCANMTQRWREIILGVWDGNWKDDPSPYKADCPYGDPDFRSQNRVRVITLLDYVDKLDQYWNSDIAVELPKPVFEPYSLPDFSLNSQCGSRHIWQIIETATKNLAYLFAHEFHSMHLGTRIDDIWIAIDVTEFISANYKIPRIFPDLLIQNWREAVIQFWREVLVDAEGNFDENNIEYREMMQSFDQLQKSNNQTY